MRGKTEMRGVRWIRKDPRDEGRLYGLEETMLDGTDEKCPIHIKVVVTV